MTTSTRRHLSSLLAAALLVAPLGALAGCGPLEEDPLHVTATFDDSAGLFVGNDVGILGVAVGEVTAITPRGSVVEVSLEIDPSVSVPASAGAVVLARSVATDRYVELTPAFADGPRMADGATIPIERTRTPAEFDEVLASLRDFSDGLAGPDGQARAIRRLLSSGADALDGRGQDANDTIRDLAVAAGELSSHRDDLTGTIDGLAQLTTTLADNDQVVDQFITSVSDATDLLADERNRFGASLSALSRALSSLATFVKENRVAFGDRLDGLADVTERLLVHEESLKEAVEVLPIAGENIGNSFGANGRLQVKMPLRHLLPAQEAIGPLCAALPAVICDELGTDPDLGAILGALTGGLL